MAENRKVQVVESTSNRHNYETWFGSNGVKQHVKGRRRERERERETGCVQWAKKDARILVNGACQTWFPNRRLLAVFDNDDSTDSDSDSDYGVNHSTVGDRTFPVAEARAWNCVLK